MKAPTIVGIIGGTGLDRDSSLLKQRKFVDLLETPYGFPSDSQAISGEIEGVTTFILSRHGKDHNISPSHVNYRANLWALVKQLGCTHLLVTSACGSLKEELEPGHIGILSQYIDRTCSFRDRSFYKVCHIAQQDPIDKVMRHFIEQECIKHELNVHKDLTCVTIEGPRFSTLAESRLFRSWGCDVVNMTSVPEVPLASELGVFYACILLITDYDCWRDGESVSADLVVERMKVLGSKAKQIIPGIIRRIAEHDWTDEMKSNQEKVAASIMTE